LDRQIDRIKPRIICPLGNFAASHVLQRYGFKPESISMIHGIKFKALGVVVIPLYHPAALIYDRSLGEKNDEDWRIVKDTYAQRTLPSS
jgi:DNA polymerase